jgi:hypothetical protein
VPPTLGGAPASSAGAFCWLRSPLLLPRRGVLIGDKDEQWTVLLGAHISPAKDKVTLSSARLLVPARIDWERTAGPEPRRRNSLRIGLARGCSRPTVRQNESSEPTLSFVGDFG